MAPGERFDSATVRYARPWMFEHGQVITLNTRLGRHLTAQPVNGHGVGADFGWRVPVAMRVLEGLGLRRVRHWLTLSDRLMRI